MDWSKLVSRHQVDVFCEGSGTQNLRQTKEFSTTSLLAYQRSNDKRLRRFFRRSVPAEFTMHFASSKTKSMLFLMVAHRFKKVPSGLICIMTTLLV